MNDFSQFFQVSVKQPSSRVLEEFMLTRGRYSNFKKETYFIRYLSSSNFPSHAEKLRAWAQGGPNGSGGYVFEPALQRQPSPKELEPYLALYRDGPSILPFRFENRIWQQAFQNNVRLVIRRFQQVKGCGEGAIIKNFTVKLLYWIGSYFPRLFVETAKMNQFPKFACSGPVKLAEYLFLYLLFLMGCDVLYLSPSEDVAVEDAALLKVSLLIRETSEMAAAPSTPRLSRACPQPEQRPSIPVSQIKRPQPAGARLSHPVREVPHPVSASPLTYEELAKLASSIVMLKIFDQNNQCFKTGSGVIISQSGYVLTNFHVAAGGKYYGILLEEETEVFYTNELIKYNQDLDLAVLRMEKHIRPIPIARPSVKLARGQKVAAIGSPLGLFNSVSDGIISGFRTLHNVSMIQFTAPISPGSSGGALLDLYGNLIGLITAGIDDGQNLNLAVDHTTISQFVHGLIPGR